MTPRPRSFMGVFSWGILVAALLTTVQSQSFQYVSRVALDRSRKLEVPYTIRSIYGHFLTNNSIWIQLWRPETAGASNRTTQHKLVWQILVTPPSANGSAQVFDLEEKDVLTLEDSSLRLGVVNQDEPGPVLEVYRSDAGTVDAQTDRGVILSETTRETLTARNRFPLPLEDVIEFDDLILPYHIPVFFCNVTGCPEYILNPPTIEGYDDMPMPLPSTTRPPITDRSRSGVLTFEWLSEGMIIGLLAWDAVLTCLVVGLIIAVIVVCHDMEKVRRRQRRLERRLTDYISRSPPSNGHSSKRYLETNDWQTTQSWQSDHSMPYTADDQAKLAPKRRSAASSMSADLEPPGVMVDSLTY